MSYTNQNQPSPGYYNPVDDDGGINFKEWLFKVLAYWWFILICFVLAMGTVYIYHRYAVPRYLVSASVLIKSEKATLGSEFLQEIGAFNQTPNQGNEIAIMKSLSLLQEVVDTLDFEVEYYASGMLKTTELYRSQAPFQVKVVQNTSLNGQVFHIELLGNKQFRIYPDADAPVNGLEEQVLSFPAIVSGPGYLLNITSEQEGKTGINDYSFRVYNTWELAKRYRGAVIIRNQDEKSSILNLSMESQIPQKSKDFLNTLVERYIQKELDDKNLTAVRTIDFINSQLTNIQDTLSTIEDRLQTFRKENRIVNISEEGNSIINRFRELEEEKADTETKLSYFEYLENYLRENRNPTKIISPSTVGIESPVLAVMVQNLNELGAQLVQLELNATDDNPQIKSLRIQMERVMEGIFENVANLKKATSLTLRELEGRFREAEKSINELPSTERAYVNIQRRFNLSENLFIYLQEKKAEAGIAKASNIPQTSMVDPAMVMYQTFPDRKRDQMLAAFLGLAVPIGLILLRYFLSQKIVGVSDIERKTKIPVLGTLAFSHFPGELVMMEHPRSLVAESFRKVRASMKFLENGKPAQVIMLTSFHSGEGKSFSAMNFASMLAKMGKKTILLGMDLRKPKMFDTFGVSNEMGLSNLLIGEKPLTDVILPTSVENLDLIVSGPVPPNPNELLASDVMGDMFASLRKNYDFVIIDTSPVGLVSDSMEIGKYADLTLFIIRHEVTPKHAIDFINDLEEKGLLPRVGIILNGVDFKKQRNQYSYDYGYGYGYGYGAPTAHGYFD